MGANQALEKLTQASGLEDMDWKVVVVNVPGETPHPVSSVHFFTNPIDVANAFVALDGLLIV